MLGGTDYKSKSSIFRKYRSGSDSIKVQANYCINTPKRALVFACLQVKSFENTVGKGEIACMLQAISRFPSLFFYSLTLYSINTHFDASTTGSF